MHEASMVKVAWRPAGHHGVGLADAVSGIAECPVGQLGVPQWLAIVRS